MKISFEVTIADSFVYPEPDGTTNLHLWPVPAGQSEHKDIIISFEPSSNDNLRDAENALYVHMKQNYPDKDYKIGYWYWL